MDLNLKEKVIIVTGGSKGIGNGICNVLASEGAIPIIIGRNEKDIYNRAFAFNRPVFVGLFCRQRSAEVALYLHELGTRYGKKRFAG